ncbi:MAG: ribosome-associated translation inhibitor RaiA [Rickettsiales bacterium]
MVISVSGKHMEVGNALQEYVQERMSAGVRKYLDHITQGKVTFSKNTYLYHVDIVIHDSSLGLVKSTSESDDVYSAFDNAILKIEKQLRKYKGRIKAHAKRVKVDDSIIAGTKYVVNVPKEVDNLANCDSHEHHEPVTIAEQATNIEKLTVSEAIMKMDLAHLPALLFINKNNNRLNVVYHRVDGNISWVDPGAM